MHLLPLVGVIHSDIKIDCQQNVERNLTAVPSQVSTCFKVTCILEKNE